LKRGYLNRAFFCLHFGYGLADRAPASYSSLLFAQALFLAGRDICRENSALAL
jgi:hypothetical protein